MTGYYRINLVDPAHMDKASMNKLRTSLREVLLYSKYSKDKKKLNELVLSDERFKHVERNAAAVINVITHSKIKFDEKEESIDMCQAIEEMRAEERLIGRDEGRKEGQAETAKCMLKLGKNTFLNEVRPRPKGT